jgi:hypothetical protein
MTRVTRPFTVEIKRSRAASRGSAAQSATPANPAFQDTLLHASAMSDEPVPRPVSEAVGGAAARLAAEALFSGPRAAVEPPGSPNDGDKAVHVGGRILADLNSKDPLEELIRLRAEDLVQRRTPRQSPVADRDDTADPPARERGESVKAPTKAAPAGVDAAKAPAGAGKRRSPAAAPSRKPAPSVAVPPAPTALDEARLSRTVAWAAPVPIVTNAVPAGRTMALRSKRRSDAAGLPRGERWKRRLPEICR